MITKDQEAALHELECNTHLLWTPEAAKELTRPFGFECRVREQIADGGPRNPKGLYLDSGAEAVVGAASWEVSGQIVDHLKIRSEGKLGRGFQVRADCDAVRRHLNGK